jgi:MinD superfamily P-loop ATPase
MKELVIISGKGGTGKTVIAASFAALAKNKVMADCDVDADLHLLLSSKIEHKEKFSASNSAFINKNLCTGCGKCVEICRFSAINDFVVDKLSCEGCGVCSYICPQKAIKMEENFSGEWFISSPRFGPMVHAKLGIAEENSGKLVTLVRNQARLIAERKGYDLIIIDGPPGIGCPVIASITGTSAALIVIEPTLSGLHDLERVAKLANHFGIKVMVCINKYDLNIEMSEKIENYCQVTGYKFLGRIPFNPVVVEALINKKPLLNIQRMKLQRTSKESGREY